MAELLQSFLLIEFNWSILETVAVIFSLLYVYLAAHQNNLCWLAAVISVSLYIYICFDAKLYAETILQVFYFLMAIYGFYSWKKNNSQLQISTWPIKKHLFIIFLGTILTFFLGFIFSNYTDAEMPLVDSFTTVFSVFATYMVVKKILSNWLYFIIIDIISTYLYFSRDLHLTSLLFLLYTFIAVAGFIKWNRISTQVND
jgi:nicotinamide mononucleotide transporter